MKCRIDAVIGRRIWDSRGRPTVEADVVLRGGARGRGMAPAGASRGLREAVELRDGERELGGYGVARAVANVNGPIARALTGLDACDQEGIDAVLCALDGTPEKSRLGGNAIVAVSMAAAHAAAAAEDLPLWAYLAGGRDVSLPLPEIQIFGGGAHAAQRIDIQDFMVMPLGAGSFNEALVMCAEVYRHAGVLMDGLGRAGVADEGGWWPQFDSNEHALSTLARAIEAAGYRNGEVAISLDIAASGLRAGDRYRFGLDGRELDRDEWFGALAGWVGRYPIVSLEDPVAEDDLEGMKALTAMLGGRVQIVGDDFLVTSAARVETSAAAGACNALLVKPNQAGTLTEARRALEAAHGRGWSTIVSARSGETEDTTIAHLAVGWGSGQLKVGSFSRSERMAKWNEVLRIEEALGPRARFAGRTALPMFKERP